MTQFSIGYAVSAKDDTRSTLASALGGITRFARIAAKPITIPIRVGREGLRIARDINLGLRPLISGLDNVIDRGARLEVVGKSFRSLTGGGAAQARRLARELVQASSGTITLAKAMETANRALASGLSFKQIATAIEFISKKSITTGKDAKQAIDTVVTGLSRGSTLFLDDFGVLVDGIDGVRRSFDKIKGAGAFDSLGPAAQKAETVRQAIAEMNVQMGKIGVSGRETVFVYQSIKNELTNSVDRLVLAVAKSKALSGILRDVRDTVGGISEFIERGGSLKDVLLGKEGGKSGGLFGLLKAGILDIGENFGRAILGGILKAIVGARDLFSAINPLSGITDSLDEFKRLIKTLPFFRDKARPIGPAAGGGDLISPSQAALDAFIPQTLRKAGVQGGAVIAARGARAFASVTERDIAARIAEGALNRKTFLANIDKPAAEMAKLASRRTTTSLVERAGVGAAKFVGKNLVPAITIADFIYTTFGFFKELKGLNDALGDATKEIENENFARKRLEETRKAKRLRESEAAGDKPLLPDKFEDLFPAAPRRGLGPHANAGVGTMGGSIPVVLANIFSAAALGGTATGKPSVFDRLDRFADRLLAGGGGRFSRELGLFRRDFPASRKPFDLGLPSLKPVDPVEVDLTNRKLSEHGQSRLFGELNLLDRQLRRIAAQTRREARGRTTQEVRRLRRAGFKIDEADRKEIERQIFDDLYNRRTVRQRARVDDIFKRLDGDTTRRGQEAQSKLHKEQTQYINEIKNAVGDMKEMVGELIGAINRGITAIAGDERAIAAAGGRGT